MLGSQYVYIDKLVVLTISINVLAHLRLALFKICGNRWFISQHCTGCWQPAIVTCLFRQQFGSRLFYLVTEDSNLLECDATSERVWFATIRSNLLPFFSRVWEPKKKFSVSSKDAAPHPKYRKVMIHYFSAVSFCFVCKLAATVGIKPQKVFSTSVSTSSVGTASSLRSNCMCWILEVQSLYCRYKSTSAFRTCL